MAEKATIARPYARAAFEYAQQHGRFEQWSASLAAATAVTEDAAVRRLLNHPHVSSAQLVGLINDVVGEHFDDPLRNFIATLAQNHRLGLLPHITQMFEDMRANAECIADVQVISAVQLEVAQQHRLAEALKKRLNRNVRMHCSVDAKLVGGAVVRYGDLVIDGSVKERLARLAHVVIN